MTISTYADLDQVHDVIPGEAVYSSGTVTFGTWADSGHVSMLLTDGHRAHNKLIVGDSGAGKTVLLQSLAASVDRQHTTGVNAWLADPLRPGCDLTEVARDMLDLIGTRSGQPGEAWPLVVLTVDHLTEASPDAVDLLAAVARFGPGVNICVVVAAQGATALMPGGPALRDSLAAGGVIEFRTVSNGIPPTFADGTTTAGVGFVNGDLFRVWWPGDQTEAC
jgi:hypothetical protein